MSATELNTADVTDWLRDQQLIYASWPASHDRRLRLTYHPFARLWEVTLGVGGINEELYLGTDVDHAVKAFNRSTSNATPALHNALGLQGEDGK
jgi:hypothetical protein